MAAHLTFIAAPVDISELDDLIERLDEAVIETARELARAKDRSFARRSAHLPMRAQALRMAFTMRRPLPELSSQIQELMTGFNALEVWSSKSRLRREERVAITIGRALSHQLWAAFLALNLQAR
jgi:hypothetical protein